MKLTIYTGSGKPFVAVGSNQVNLLKFAYRYQNWHTYRIDKPTLRAIEGLERRGTIIVNRTTKQFRINTEA